jgi:hypothetical protein
MSWAELVSDTVYRKDMPGIPVILFYLLPELHYEIVHGAIGGEIIRSPDLI